MITDLLILIICSLATTILGLFVFARNPSLPTNKQFALLALSLVAWTVFNYLSDHANSNVLLYTRLVFFGGIGTIYALMTFVANFPNGMAFHKNNYLRLHTALSAFLLITIFTPFFISKVTITGKTSGTITTSYLYPLFLVYFVYSLVLIGLVMWKQHVQVKTLQQRQQVLMLSTGIVLYAIFAGISNVLLPLLSDKWSSTRFGPLFALFFVGMVAYGIIRHKLFDVRLVVARVLGYAGSLIFIAVIYGFVVLGISKLVFGLRLSVGIQILLSAATGLAGVYFGRIQKEFDKITNRLFYRDAYDPQLLFNELNQVLISTYKLTPLLTKISEVIERNLKPVYVVIGVNNTSTTARKIMGTKGKYTQLSEVDSAIMHKLIPPTKRELVVVDELESKYDTLKEFLRTKNVAIVAWLSSANKQENIGYLTLGSKKSGNPYSEQDLRVIKIVVNELFVAIQNALHTEEIENFNITLQQKVNEATRKLRKANERLKELDETKDDFITMASHQLRTPLTSVKGFLSMVIEGDAGKINKTQREMLDQAFFSSQRMVYLIADLLNVSRLKTGKFIIESTKVNLGEMVEQETAQLQETAEMRSLQLSCLRPKNFPDLILDETKTRQVIMNFIDNAIYYTPRGGR